MKQFEIEFYEKDTGECPVEEFLLQLDKTMRAKISRVLFFFYYGGKIIVTNGFVKKTLKTPRAEIEKAKKYRNDYVERCKKNEKI